MWEFGGRSRPLRGVLATLLGAACAVACTQVPPAASGSEPRGPARVRPPVVAAHALQFDRELPRRLAGSQQEEAAAAYILGHLQRAGYVVRLLGVPLANSVSSVDVVALPSGAARPNLVVSVAYDSSPGRARDGSGIGVFLELARALRAADPDHRVEFVALGAERARVGGGLLGSRRLASELAGENRWLSVLTIEGARGRGLWALGKRAAELRAIAQELEVRTPVEGASPELERQHAARERVFSVSGIEQTTVGGSPNAVGRVVLRYLRSRSSS